VPGIPLRHILNFHIARRCSTDRGTTNNRLFVINKIMAYSENSFSARRWNPNIANDARIHKYRSSAHAATHDIRAASAQGVSLSMLYALQNSCIILSNESGAWRKIKKASVLRAKSLYEPIINMAVLTRVISLYVNAACCQRLRRRW
jgi:hypothetical protein